MGNCEASICPRPHYKANYNEKKQIKALVMKSIQQASERTLEKHDFACLRLMKLKLTHNKLSEILLSVI